MGIRGAHFWGCLYSLDTGTSGDEESYVLESVVRGHHVYMTDWTPVIGEMLRGEFTAKMAILMTDMLLLLVVTDLWWDTYLSNFQEFRGIFCNMVAEFCVRLLGEGRGPLHC